MRKHTHQTTMGAAMTLVIERARMLAIRMASPFIAD
jgi:hypothetical protein